MDTQEHDSLAQLGASSALTELLGERCRELGGGANWARVSRIDRGQASVVTAAGPAQLRLRSQEPPLTVGDWLVVSACQDLAGVSDHASPGAQVLLEEVLPRYNQLVRHAPGRRTTEQVLASNVDVVLVVVPLDRAVAPRAVERCLALSWESGATPCVLLTKADTCKPDLLNDSVARVDAAAAGTEVLVTSAHDGTGLPRVRDLLCAGRTGVLLGGSGAGKSSLINTLAGSDLVIGKVRDSDGKGRHTTTWRELVQLPEGGALIDTPGLRGLGLWLGSAGVDAAFVDIAEVEPGCKFSDCQHQGEPGCAVQAALDNGGLSPDRVASYHKLRKEVAYVARKSDWQLAKQDKQMWKQRSKDGRVKKRP